MLASSAFGLRRWSLKPGRNRRGVGGCRGEVPAAPAQRPSGEPWLLDSTPPNLPRPAPARPASAPRQTKGIKESGADGGCGGASGVECRGSPGSGSGGGRGAGSPAGSRGDQVVRCTAHQPDRCSTRGSGRGPNARCRACTQNQVESLREQEKQEQVCGSPAALARQQNTAVTQKNKFFCKKQPSTKTIFFGRVCHD